MARNPPAAEHAEHHLRDDGHPARGRRGGRVREPAERRVRHRARRQDADQLQLLGRRPARARLGHGPRRDLRGIPDAERRDGREHQPGARRRPLPRRQPAERQPAESRRRRSRPSSCGPTSATRTSRSARTSARATTTRCRCSSIAATSAGCSSPSPTRSPRPSATAPTSSRCVRRLGVERRP